MNYLNKLFEFTSIEDGKKNLKEAYSIRDQMGGALYWNAVNHDCKEIAQKLEDLKRDNISETEIFLVMQNNSVTRETAIELLKQFNSNK